MKKIKYLYIILITILLLPIKVFAKEETYGTYVDATNTIKEVLGSYYMRGQNLQYRYYSSYPGDLVHPEDITTQDVRYTESEYDFFTYAFEEAFGYYNYITRCYIEDIYSNVSSYLNKHNLEDLDDSYILYYVSNNKNIDYVYNNQKSIENFADVLNPGDMVAYGSNRLIVYDVVINPNTNKKDALLLGANGGNVIKTRLQDVDQIFYDFLPSPINGVAPIDVNNEGAIKKYWLSDLSGMVNNGKLSCTKENCAIVRFFHKGDNNEAIFNQSVEENVYEISKMRSSYPGLYIEKTVDKQDNNFINLGDKLTYTIIISNTSDYAYKRFYVEEALGDLITYESSNGNYQDGTIKWEVNYLRSGSSISLTYTVLVDVNYDNLNKNVVSEGKFYENNDQVYITTGTIENKIVQKVTKRRKSYQSCINNLTTKDDLEMIEQAYSCVFGETSFSFKDFDFHSIFRKIAVEPCSYREYTNVDPIDEDNVFYKMILNNYWNDTEYYEGNIYQLNTYVPRADIINQNVFKNGDILIYNITNSTYTEENGLYAYIYVGNKFFNLGNDRYEFTHPYYFEKYENLYSGHEYIPDSVRERVLTYINFQTLFDKDYYIILRPEKVIKENAGIKVNENTLPKTVYLLNTDEELDITGATLTVQYNDGTTKTVNLTDDDVTVSGYSNKKVGKKTITVTYEDESTTFDINVIKKEISKIEINKLPTKTEYFVGDKLDTKGLSIKVTYNDNTTKIVSDGFTVNKITLNNVGEEVVTVTFEEKTTTFKVNVKENKLEKIEINTLPKKTKYVVGEAFDPTGLTIKEIYSNGTTKVIKSGFKLSNTSFTTKGTKTISVTYKNLKTTFKVTVEAKKITKISVYKKPTKLTYKEGQKLNTGGLKLKVTYNDGTVKYVTKNFTVDKKYLLDSGKQTITVTYKDVKTTYKVTVKEVGVKEIKLAKGPNKVIFKVGDKFTTEGLKLEVTYKDGRKITLTSEYTLSLKEGTKFKTKGLKKVKLSFKDKSIYMYFSVK